jgi:hypothetical protein
MTPIARTRRNVTVGSVACMGQAAFSGLEFEDCMRPGVATIASRCDYRWKAKRSIRAIHYILTTTGNFRSTPITGRSLTLAACLRCATRRHRRLRGYVQRNRSLMRCSVSSSVTVSRCQPGPRVIVRQRSARYDHGEDTNQLPPCRGCDLSLARR